MRLAVLPARGGSKRLPGKNIRMFCGRPVIAYPIEAARDSGLFDAVHVSTDDPSVMEVAAANGFPVDFPRIPNLCDDHTPLVPVLSWVLDQYLKRGLKFNEVCLILPCSPLITAQDLRDAHKVFMADSRRLPVLSVVEFPVPIEWAMQTAEDGRLLPVYPGKAAIRSQDLAKRYYDSGNFTFFTAESLLSGKAPDADGYRPFLLPRTRGLDIDGADDFSLAEALYRGGER